MNGRELAMAAYESARPGTFPNKEAAVSAVNAIFDEISKSLVRGDKVVVTGFGRFDLSATAARTGRNPRSGEPVEIPARRHARFTPSPSLRASLRPDD